MVGEPILDVVRGYAVVCYDTHERIVGFAGDVRTCEIIWAFSACHNWAPRMRFPWAYMLASWIPDPVDPKGSKSVDALVHVCSCLILVLSFSVCNLTLSWLGSNHRPIVVAG